MKTWRETEEVEAEVKGKEASSVRAAWHGRWLQARGYKATYLLQYLAEGEVSATVCHSVSPTVCHTSFKAAPPAEQQPGQEAMAHAPPMRHRTQWHTRSPGHSLVACPHS